MSGFLYRDHVRNAIDHSNIKYNLNKNFDSSNFVFTDKKAVHIRTITQFIIDYFKIVKLIFTLDLLCKFYDLRLEHQGRLISEIFVDEFILNFPNMIEELNKLPELKRENFEVKKE